MPSPMIRAYRPETNALTLADLFPACLTDRGGFLAMMMVFVAVGLAMGVL